MFKYMVLRAIQALLVLMMALAFWILLLSIPKDCGGDSLSVLFRAEPWAGDSYIRDVSGEWRYYKEPLSFGLKLSIDLSQLDTVYISSRGIIDGGIVGIANRVSLWGANGAIRINYEYTFFMYNEQYGYLMNNSPRQRMWVSLDIPIIGGGTL